MRFMMMVKADKNSEAGAMPGKEVFDEMDEYTQQMVQAGVMLAGEGLHPSSRGARASGSRAAASPR